MALSCYLIGDNGVVFRQLLKHWVSKFCTMFVEECVKDADCHLRLLIAWNKYTAPCMLYIASMSTTSSSGQWTKLTSGYWVSGHNKWRMSECCYISSLLRPVHLYCSTKRSHIWQFKNTMCDSSVSPSADYDATLYHLFGFSNFSSLPMYW